MSEWDALPSAFTVAAAVIAYIEVRVTQRVNSALAELEAARKDRRDDTGEGEGPRRPAG
jgi:hypothetical protein